MRRSVILSTVFATVLILVLPFFGGAGPSPISASAHADSFSSSSSVVQPEALVPTQPTEVSVAVDALKVTQSVELVAAQSPSSDSEHLAQKPVPPPVVVEAPGAKASGTAARRAALAAAGQSCPGNVGGAAGSAPGATSAQGVGGTTSGDLASFAANYNAIRVANCLEPVPMSHFRYDSCMEQRLFWMAQDPSSDPGNTWGHVGVHSIAPDANGVYYSDAVPSVGCDGNLAGGSGMSGAGAAQRWWDSLAHRKSLYKPTNTGSTAGVCINFAMTHGDGNLGAEPYTFTRAAAKWVGC